MALDAIAGSGPGGTITAEDVRRAAGAPERSPAAAAAAAAPGRSSVTAPPAGARERSAAAPDSASPDGEQRIPLRGLRRRIAEHMRRSLSTAAPFTFVAECDWSE